MLELLSCSRQTEHSRRSDKSICLDFVGVTSEYLSSKIIVITHCYSQLDSVGWLAGSGKNFLTSCPDSADQALTSDCLTALFSFIETQDDQAVSWVVVVVVVVGDNINYYSPSATDRPALTGQAQI